MLVRAETKLVNKDTTMQQHRDASLSDSDEETGPGRVTVTLLLYITFTFSQSFVVIFVLSFETESYSVARLPIILTPQSPKCFPRQGMVQAEWPQVQQC